MAQQYSKVPVNGGYYIRSVDLKSIFPGLNKANLAPPEEAFYKSKSLAIDITQQNITMIRLGKTLLPLSGTTLPLPRKNQNVPYLRITIFVMKISTTYTQKISRIVQLD